MMNIVMTENYSSVKIKIPEICHRLERLTKLFHLQRISAAPPYFQATNNSVWLTSWTLPAPVCGKSISHLGKGGRWGIGVFIHDLTWKHSNIIASMSSPQLKSTNFAKGGTSKKGTSSSRGWCGSGVLWFSSIYSYYLSSFINSLFSSTGLACLCVAAVVWLKSCFVQC